MARTRTLALLRADVLWQADREGTSLRNVPDQITRAINQSIAEFREAVSEGGNPYFLKVTPPANLSVGPTDPYHFAVLDLSALTPEHLRVYGFDIQVSNVWYSLEPALFRERNDIQRTRQLGMAQPRQFFQFERSTVAYAPASDTAYPYLIWYLPVHTDLVADGDTFDGLNGWEDWVVFNSVARLLLRDRDAHLERFEAERTRLMARVLHVAKQRQRAGAVVRGGNFGFDDRRRGYGRGDPFLGGAGSDGLNEPGTGEVGRVALAKSGGKINWHPGVDEGDDLKLVADATIPTGLAWHQRRGWIKPAIDLTGVVDATAEIQRCLTVATGRLGSVVEIPDGIIKVGSTSGSSTVFTVPWGVTVTGPEKPLSRGNRVFGNGTTPDAPQQGALFNHYGTGRLFQMHYGSAVRNIHIFDPNQVTNATPLARDFWLYTSEPDVAFENIALINPYKGIFISAPGYVNGITGWPLAIGIHLARIADVQRVKDVQFNPSCNFTNNTATTLKAWVVANGKAFVLDGPELFELTDCFSLGYNKNFVFEDLDGDGFLDAYGEITGGGCDGANECITLEASCPLNNIGLKLSNVTLVSTTGATGAGILCQDNTGTSRRPYIFGSNLTIHGSYNHVAWAKSTSRARVVIANGFETGCLAECFLNDSANAAIDLSKFDTDATHTRLGGTGTIYDTDARSY